MRIGFTDGDRFFWPSKLAYTPFRGALSEWRESLTAEIHKHGITDIVLYGDTRPIHAEAVLAAKEMGQAHRAARTLCPCRSLFVTARLVLYFLTAAFE